MAEAITIAILARAPVPGRAKTRLIPELGPEGAAALQAKLISHTLKTATAVGRVTLWATPDVSHAVFQKARAHVGVTLAPQPDGDLGARMLAAFVAAKGPALVIGTDSPALTPQHLRDAAEVLRCYDSVLIPAEDGGYVLIGLRKPQPALFSDIDWGTPTVMAETRFLLSAHNLTWRELPPLWDVDTPDDLERLKQAGLPGLP